MYCCIRLSLLYLYYLVTNLNQSPSATTLFWVTALTILRWKTSTNIQCTKNIHSGLGGGGKEVGFICWVTIQLKKNLWVKSWCLVKTIICSLYSCILFEGTIWGTVCPGNVRCDHEDMVIYALVLDSSLELTRPWSTHTCTNTVLQFICWRSLLLPAPPLFYFPHLQQQ